MLKNHIFVWVCVGICVDKAGNLTGISCPLLYFTPDPTNGPAWTIQVDMVAPQAKETMVG